MKIKNNIPDNKGKALYGFVGLLSCSIALLFWPQQSGHSQPEIKPPNEALQKVDSVLLLRDRNDRQDSINLVEAHSLVQLTKALNQKQRKKADIKIKVMKPTIVLRYNGEIFEAEDIETYKGYLIVNIDSFLASTDTVVIPVCNTDSCFDVPAPAPPAKKKSWLKRIFSHQ